MTLKKSILSLIALVFVFGLSGCDFLNSGNGKPDKNDMEKISFVVYRPDKDGEWLHAEKHEVEIKKDADKLKTALDTLIEKKPVNDKLVNIFPEKAKILSVKAVGGTAEVNLSKDILQGHSGGSLSEMMIVTSIVNTATEFPDISKVQILVDGKKIESIGGHMDVLDSLQRNESLIKK